MLPKEEILCQYRWHTQNLLCMSPQRRQFSLLAWASPTAFWFEQFPPSFQKQSNTEVYCSVLMSYPIYILNMNFSPASARTWYVTQQKVSKDSVCLSLACCSIKVQTIYTGYLKGTQHNICKPPAYSAAAISMACRMIGMWYLLALYQATRKKAGSCVQTCRLHFIICQVNI